MAGGKVLILGGIRSGKSELAESLLADVAQVSYVATSAQADEGFTERIEAHKSRRPASWSTVETGADPRSLIETVRDAGASAPVLVDDLGGWATTLLGQENASELISELAEAVRTSAARIVLVSPEVGLSVVPATEAGVRFADLMGELNRSVAGVCDEVSLVIAGQTTTLKKSTAPAATIWSAPAVVPATPVIPPSIPPAAPAQDPAGPGHGLTAATGSATAGAAGAAAGGLVQPDTSPTAQPAGTAAPASVLTPANQGVADALGSLVTRVPAQDALTGQTAALPIIKTGLTIKPGMDLPIPDEAARTNAEAHLATLDIPGPGLGDLAKVVVFAAGTQGSPVPRPWSTPHLLLLNGTHEGNVAAGDSVTVSSAIAAGARQGEGAYGLLAGQHGVAVKVIDAGVSGDISDGYAASPEVVEQMLTQGWQLADEAVDSGADLIILGSCGAGAATAAAGLVARVTGGEVVGLLGRIVGPDGMVDDPAWILRAGALRDALHRTRNKDLNALTLLSELGGPDFALAAGVILGATARRTPVMLDGPVAAASALLARDLGSQSRLWCLVPDHGAHPVTKAAADVIGAEPLLDLHTGLGEGTMPLLALPLLNSALMLAATLPVKPPVLPAPPEFAAPQVSAPDVSAPGVSAPGVSGPAVSGPAVSGPAVSAPGVSGPGAEGSMPLVD
jgi:nicotinate-nucleotide--dimethylbenzimidazole phosphoribosyltransferase